jgi:hypothetical protein
MARAKKKKRKISQHQRAFGKVAKASNVVCHRETNSVAGYKKCMSTNMVAGLKKAGVTKKGRKSTAAKKKTKSKSKTITCVGLRKSGPKKGTLKPGFTWKGGAQRNGCPRKVR